MSEFDGIMREIKNEKYRITTALLGFLMVASGTVLGLSSFIADFIVVSCLLSLGTSCLFHTLLGGIEKGELDFNAKEKNKLLGVLPEYIANIKVSGPVITFIILWCIFYGGGILQRHLKAKAKDQVSTILKQVSIEPNEGLIITTKDSVSPEITLSYRNGSPYEVKHRVKISSESENIRDMLSGNQLEIIIDENQNNIEKFRVRKSDFSLGNIKSQEIKKLLVELAEKTSRDDGRSLTVGNSLTRTILHNCVSLEGICKVPNQYQVKVYFDANLHPINEAKICPRHPVLSMNKITKKPFSLTSNKNSIQSSKIIRIDTFSEAGEFCTQDSFNSIKIASKYKPDLFPNGEDSELVYLSYTRD